MAQEQSNTKVNKTWGAIYALVIGVLVLVILLLHLFTHYFE